jgi:glycosyltransferase involved in cell wall biosynthesis
MMLGAEHALQISFFLKIYRSVTRKIIDSPQCVICPSRFLKEFYDAYGFFQASKKVVLQNPVAQFVDAGIAQKTKKNITYLYLGQLEEHKGIVFLLHIFMSWNDPDVRFVIAGAGSREMDAVLAAEKDSRISYYGYCAEEKKEQLFSDVHFLVVPSLCYENAPAVISESFTHGVPVIVAKIGGAHELVEDKKNGFLFTAGDAQSAKDALVLTKNSIDRYEDLSENARAGIRHNTTQEYCKKMLILTHSELRGA